MVTSQLLDRRYQIMEILESTDIGKTYLAKDTRRPGDSLCFVKHLLLAAEEPEFVEIVRRRFQQEAQTLEKLSEHDQIPHLLAYFEENREFYLVESYVEGQSLANEIQPGQPLPEHQLIKILIEVLEVLIFVHGHGVIHRDIKPSNLSRRNSDGKLILLDFGVVKEINLHENYSPRTARVGTLEYMPVEQFEGHPQLNSDIYALGMIGVQALTGLPIYELRRLREGNQSNGREIAWRHLAIVSQELGDILDKMVRYDHRQRYQSAGEVLAALRRLSDRPQTTAAKLEVYRSEVRRCADHRGDISVVGRKILDEMRLSLELDPEEIEPIEDEILNPYRKYHQKGERYEQALAAAIRQEYPFSPETIEELKRLQQILGISDDDVAVLEQQVLPKSFWDKLAESIPGLKSKSLKRLQPHRSSPTAYLPRRTSPNPWILVGTSLAALLALGLAIFEFQRRQDLQVTRLQQQQLDQQALSRIKQISGRGSYELCINEATKIPETSSQFVEAKSLLQQCQDALSWRVPKVQDFAQVPSEVNAIAFSPDGKYLASGSQEGLVKIWDAVTGELLETFEGDSSPIWAVNFSPDGQELATGSDLWRILEWNLANKELFVPLEHAGAIWSVDISPNEQTIASASSDLTVRVWDRQSGLVLFDFPVHTDIVYAVAFTPDGTQLVSGSQDQTIKIISLETGEVLKSLDAHSGGVRTLAVSPDGQKIVSGGFDDTVKIWSLETGKLLQTLSGHSGDVLSVAISPDGRSVASGSADRTVKVWSLETGELLNTLTGHTNEVDTVAFSPDGRVLASGGKDRAVKFWKQ
ncbi:MAG: protein kinase domain-containing protein [Microcoleaceae cyanobacterium]